MLYINSSSKCRSSCLSLEDVHRASVTIYVYTGGKNEQSGSSYYRWKNARNQEIALQVTASTYHLILKLQSSTQLFLNSERTIFFKKISLLMVLPYLCCVSFMPWLNYVGLLPENSLSFLLFSGYASKISPSFFPDQKSLYAVVIYLFQHF